MRAPFLPISFILIILVINTLGQIHSNEGVAPAFELKRWTSGETVRLKDFAGEIVVLDFFAYWCVPCLRSARDLEEGIQRYYQSQGGNAHGIPLRVISINIEQAQTLRTEAFIRKTGQSFVVNDEHGRTLQHYGGTGIPYLVVIDAATPPTGADGFPIVYQHTGFEGVETLRHVIDSIGAPEDELFDVQRKADAPRIHTVEADTEAMRSSDIFLNQSTIGYQQTQGKTEHNISLSYASIDMDFSSPDIFTMPAKVREDRTSAQLGLRHGLRDFLSLLASTGVYDGFAAFQSAWLHEFYRQRYGLFGYQEADPWGYNLSMGTRWEYLPGTGFLQADASWANDKIAPGAEFDGTLVLGNDELKSGILSVSTENVLSRRIRTLLEFNVTDTTDRELRYSAQGYLNLALGERWVLRSFLGGTKENPELEAVFVGATAEYEWTPSLRLSIGGRFYHDTGEIENSLLFSTAAPGIEAYQIGVGMRYTWARSALKIYAAPYFTRHDAIASGTEFFGQLYSDRDWGILQIAYSFTF